MNQEIIDDINNVASHILAWFEHTSFYTLFMDVPQKNKISYVTHVWRHVKQSIYLAYLSISLWIHAFFPFLCPSERKELPKQDSIDIGSESVLKPEKESLDNGTAL